jgi:hypothetical protein
MSIILQKRRLIDQTSTLAIAQTVEITNLLIDRSIPEIAEQLRLSMPAVTDTYSTVTAQISSTAYNESRTLARPPSEYVATPRPPDTNVGIQAAIGFGIAQLTKGTDYSTFQSTLAGSVQKLVNLGDRNTVELNIAEDPDGTRYQRVPSPGACAFCMTMAAVAEVQRSEEFDGYHNFCRCTLNPVFTGQEGIRLPEYDKFEQAYNLAASELEKQREEVGWYSMKTREAAKKFPQLTQTTKNRLRLVRQITGDK